MSDLEGDLAWLAAHHRRWTLHHPAPGVADWRIVAWRDAPVRRSEDAVVIEDQCLAGVLAKAAQWFRDERAQ